jgi:hypothetical protein
MRRRFLGLALAVAATLSGCRTWEFVRTDPRFEPHEVERAPDLYVHRLPTCPYRPVGSIELEGAARRQGHLVEDSLALAREHGQELGCELVIDRLLLAATAGGRQPSPLQATLFTPGVGGFVCGVYDLSGTTTVSPECRATFGPPREGSLCESRFDRDRCGPGLICVEYRCRRVAPRVTSARD